MSDDIDIEELLSLAKGGAKISSDSELVVIDKWETLIDQLSRIAKANEELVKKQSEEIKGTLNKLIEVLSENTGNSSIDVDPIIRAISNIKLNAHIDNNHQSYEFDIERNNRGLMSKIKVRHVN